MRFLKWIKKICEWNIIMNKTTITSIETLEAFSSFNKNFKDKIEKPKQ